MPRGYTTIGDAPYVRAYQMMKEAAQILGADFMVIRDQLPGTIEQRARVECMIARQPDPRASLIQRPVAKTHHIGDEIWKIIPLEQSELAILELLCSEALDLPRFLSHSPEEQRVIALFDYLHYRHVEE